MPQLYPPTSVGCRPCTVNVAGTKGVDPPGVAKRSGPVKVVKCQSVVSGDAHAVLVRGTHVV